MLTWLEYMPTNIFFRIAQSRVVLIWLISQPPFKCPQNEKSVKATRPRIRADTLNTARHHGRAAHQFPAPKDDEYVHTGSSLSDAESAEEERGDTSPGNIIYINVIYCVTRIGYSSSTATSTKETRAGRYTPVETIRNRQSSNSSSAAQRIVAP
jgi:hypothetical protein